MANPINLVTSGGLRRWMITMLTVGLLALGGCTGGGAAHSKDPGEHAAGQFGGALAGTEALIGISSGPERITVLVSDNRAISEWFITDAPADDVLLASSGGAVAELEFGADEVTGTITLTDGARHSFSAQPQSAPVIRRARAASEDEEVLAGWVTLADRTTGALSIQPRTGSRIIGPAPAIPDAEIVTLRTPRGSLMAPMTTVAGDATSVTPNRSLTFLVAGVGDSYASGEGNPVDRPSTSLDEDANLDERPTNLAEMWGPTDGMNGCHRSDNAGIPTAFRALAEKYPEFAMKLVFVACGGSRIEHVTGRPPGQVPGPDETQAWGSGKRGDVDEERTDRWEDIDEPAQLQQVDAQVSELDVDPGSQSVDVLAMSIGGNDAGFASVVGRCVMGGLPANIDGIDPEAEAIKVAQLAGIIEPAECQNDARLNDALDNDGLPAVLPPDMDAAEFVKLRREVPGWDAVLDRYAGLDKTLERFAAHRPIGQVLITQYGAGLKDDDGNYCGGRNGKTKDDLFGFIDTDEAAWLDTNLLGALNDRVDTAAERANQDGLGPTWKVVNAHVAQFGPHGPCSHQPWTHRNNTALVDEGNNFPDSPSDKTRERLDQMHLAISAVAGTGVGCGAGTVINVTLFVPGCVAGGVVGVVGFESAEKSLLSAGMAHPNKQGWTAVGNALLPEMEATFKRTFTPLPADRLRQHGATENGSIVLRWDDHSSTESRYEVKVFDINDPNQPVAQIANLPANTVEHIFSPTGPFVGTFTVRACNEAFCSPFKAPVKITNIPPGVPTDVGALTKEHQPLAGASRTTLTVNATDPRNADTATLIQLTQLTNSAGGPIERDPAHFTSPAPFPTGFSFGVPDGLATGRYRVRAASCNVFGCSDFSAPVDSVAAPPGPPTLPAELPPFFLDNLGLARPSGGGLPFDPLGPGPSDTRPDPSDPVGDLDQPPASGSSPSSPP